MAKAKKKDIKKDNGGSKLDIISKLRKAYDSGLPDKSDMASTGIKSVDLLLGGGLPWTCIHEFYGKSKTGKCVGKHTVLFADGWKTIDEILFPFPYVSYEKLEDGKWYALNEPTGVATPDGSILPVTNVYYGGLKVCRAIVTDYGMITATPDHKLGLKDSFMLVKDLSVGDYLEFTIGRKIYGNKTCDNLQLLGVMCASALTSNFKTVEDLVAYILSPEMEGTYPFVMLYKYFPMEVNRITKVPKVIKAMVEFESICNKLKEIGFLYTADIPYVVRDCSRDYVLEFLAHLLIALNNIGVIIRKRGVKSAGVTLYVNNTVASRILHVLFMNEGLFPKCNIYKEGLRLVFDETVYSSFTEMLTTSLSKKKGSVAYSELTEMFRSSTPNPQTKYAPIREIQNVITEVYDLEIPSKHYYMANGITSHNSYLMQKVLAMAQKKDENVVGVILDRENGYVRSRTIQTGIQEDRIIYIPPTKIPTIDDGFDKIFSIIEDVRSSEDGDKIKLLFIIDSIDAFSVSGTSSGEERGRRAKQFHKRFRELVPMMENVMVLAANHVTYNPKVMFGNSKTKGGGVALDNYRDVGLELTNKNKYTKDGKVIGYFIKIHIDKARKVPIHRETVVYLDFEKGVHPISGYLHLLALYTDLVKPSNKQTFNFYNDFPMFIYADDEVEVKISEKNISRLLEFLKKHKSKLWFEEMPS